MSVSVRVQPFRCRSRRGLGIKGILFEPVGGRSSQVGFLYLPGIVLGATAVHRLGVEIGQRLALAGYAVCLFDQTGVGESEGDFPEGSHQKIASWVESGSLVEDTVDACGEFRRRTQVSSVALIGHCGGALTALYATARDSRVRAALLLCPPTVIMGKRDEHARSMVVDQGFSLYVRKIASIEAWQRLLRGKSDYSLLVPLVRRKIVRVFRQLASRLGVGRSHGPASGAVGPAAKERDFNPLFENALLMAQADRKFVRVVFGDRDPDVDDFRAFASRHPALSHDILNETSHGFVTQASQALLWSKIDDFAACACAQPAHQRL